MASRTFLAREILRIVAVQGLPFTADPPWVPEAPPEAPPGWAVEQMRRVKGAA
jgi:hypothetical protein